MVTAPKSGAEIIPFSRRMLICRVPLHSPYSMASLSNRFSQPQVFRGRCQYFFGVLRSVRVGVILILGHYIRTGWLMLLKKYYQAPSRRRLPS